MRLFTVRWPSLARVEAIAFFPVALLLAPMYQSVRELVESGVVPKLAPLHAELGIPNAQIILFAAGLVVFVPYVVALIVIDRMLTIRKGYAVLSIAVIAFAAFAGYELAGLLVAGLPDALLLDPNRLPHDQQIALMAGGIAFLLHARPLWIGLRDDGDVAERLVLAEEEDQYRRANGYQRSSLPKDVYHRHTAGFREWAPQQHLERMNSGPREHGAVKVLAAITWIAVVGGLGFAYLWHNFPLRSAAAPAAPAAPSPPPPPRVQAGGGSFQVRSLPLVPVAEQPAATQQQAPPPRSAAHDLPAVITLAPLPAVQRPSDVSANIQGSSGYVGPNEAVAERNGDGSFAFDAVVNGSHLPMLFDTGATVVGIRGEDAPQLGIAMNRLNYSAKVKTANGIAEVAPVIIDTLTVGNITLHGIPGFVAKQGALQANLLGQSFLVRLAGYNVERNMLLLKGR
jgi:clan AA aspartic protease (TIGR02281 family)